VYSSNGKLLYSNVNRKDINHVCPFHCEDFKDHLAISTEDELTIGTVDDIQKLHIRTIPLQEQPKRICHQPQTRVFAVVTMMASDVELDNYEEVYYLRVYDDQTFEVLDSVELEPYETACSLISTSFTEKEDDASYFVVGTAFCLPGEQEPSKGRILVFQLTEQKKLAKVTELDVPGAVYTMSTFQEGKLVAGVDSKLQIYTWSVVESDGSRVLRRECGHHGHIIVLYIAVRGDFVVVGDLMKSVSLLQYKPPGSNGSSDGVGSIEEVAKDFDANWMTAVSTIDDHTFIGAEHEYNIFTVRRNNDATSDEEKKRLEVVGAFHVGEFINAFRHGSLVMQVPQAPDTLTVAPPIEGSSGDSSSGAMAMSLDGPTAVAGGPGADAAADPAMPTAPTLLFATVNGVIGVVAQLPPKQYQRFAKLQVCTQPIG
jgi:DNA damage-binding protein 1